MPGEANASPPGSPPTPDLVGVAAGDPLKQSESPESRHPVPAPEDGIQVQLAHKAQRDSGVGDAKEYFTLCFACTLTFAAIAMAFWSSIGYGEDVLKWFRDNHDFAFYFSCTLVVLISFLYLLDFFWPPHIDGQYLVLYNGDPCVGKFLLGVCVACFIAACLFSAQDYPSVPLAITIFLSPSCVLLYRMGSSTSEQNNQVQEVEEVQDKKLEEMMQILKGLTGSERDAVLFYKCAAAAFFLSACGVLTWWLFWAAGRKSDFDRKIENISDSDEKDVQYILWCAPLGVSCSYLVFCLIFMLRVAMARSYEATNKLKNHLIVFTGAGGASGLTELQKQTHFDARLTQVAQASQMTLSEEKKQQYLGQHELAMRQLAKIVKIVFASFFLLFGSVYVAAEMVAADGHMALMFQGFLGAFFITFFAVVWVSFRRLFTAMHGWLKTMPLFRMAAAVSTNDWVRAFGLSILMPVIPVFLAVSAVNQAVRRCRRIKQSRDSGDATAKAKRAPSDEKAPSGQAPGEAQAVKEKTPLRQTQSSLHGEIDVSVNAEDTQGQCLTYRVHVVVQAILKEWNWVSIWTKLYIWGTLMVLYILSPRLLNVVLAWLNDILSGLEFWLILVLVWASGMSCFLLPPVPGVPVYIFGGLIVADQSPSGFWAGVGIAIGLCFFMKLCACAMQQKLIGEQLGNNITIRQQVGVHTASIRAIEAILRVPGWTVGKVAILCGGPDWPTSVLAGVLRLPLCQMELGTLPIIFFVAPCVMSGAFYLKQEDSETWSRSGNLMIMFTMVVNIVLWAAAGWAIQDQFDKNYEFISRPMEKYLELDWRDHSSKELAAVASIRWQDIPGPLKLTHIFFGILITCVGQYFYWRSTDCFGDFAVNDNIKDLTWYGEDDSIFLVGGLIGCITAAVSLVFLWVFFKWSSLRTRTARLQKAEELKLEEEEWKERRIRECKARAEATSPENAEAFNGRASGPPIQVDSSRPRDKE